MTPEEEFKIQPDIVVDTIIPGDPAKIKADMEASKQALQAKIAEEVAKVNQNNDAAAKALEALRSGKPIQDGKV